jgi:hypothetical protein
MERLLAHFRNQHQILIAERAAARLADTVRAMRNVDPGILLGVMGSDMDALVPRRIDVTLAELRAALEGRRSVA